MSMDIHLVPLDDDVSVLSGNSLPLQDVPKLRLASAPPGLYLASANAGPPVARVSAGRNSGRPILGSEQQHHTPEGDSSPSEDSNQQADHGLS
jgi:hypothetical protein